MLRRLWSLAGLLAPPTGKQRAGGGGGEGVYRRVPKPRRAEGEAAVDLGVLNGPSYREPS